MKTKMLLVKGNGTPWFSGERKIASWEHGFLWIGNDDEHDMACFATLPRIKAVALAKAILAWKPAGRGRRAGRAAK